MILEEKDAKSFLEKVLGYSKAESCILRLTGSNLYNLRFALNSLSTNGFSDGLTLYITSNFGKRSGVVSVNKLNDDKIEQAVKRSEEIARLSPENKEFMPPIGPQKYEKSINFSSNTEKLTPEKRAEMVSPVLEKTSKQELIAAGYFQDDLSFSAIMNTEGLFAYNKGSKVNFSTTIRTKDGSGSSRLEKLYVDSEMLNTEMLSDIVIKKSLLSSNPTEMPPGKYTVVLEPAAVADIISYCTYFMDARPADEGRSFFSKNGKGNKIGNLLVNPEVTIYSDPVSTDVPSIPFSYEGYPLTRTFWFENGVLKNLMRNRYWSQKTNEPVVPFYSNLIINGTEKSTDDLVRSTENGVLVTRFWYIRTVDPQTLLLTGLTRDGLFEIKDGKISKPIKNFRFNESPINVLKNVLEIGKPENAVGSEAGEMQIFAPALKVKDFNFSSISDAV